MKPLNEMSVGEVAAYVAEHLRQSDINVVLTQRRNENIFQYLGFGSLRCVAASLRE